MLIFSSLRIVTRKSSRRSKKNLACTRGSGSLHLDGTREWTESVSAKIKSRTRWEGSAAGRLPYKLKLLFSTESFRDRLRKTFLLEILFGRKSFSRRRVSTTKAFHAFHTSSFRLRALSLKMGHAVWSRVILFNPDEFLFLLNRIYFANQIVRFLWILLVQVELCSRYSPSKIIRARISILSNTWRWITR